MKRICVSILLLSLAFWGSCGDDNGSGSPETVEGTLHIDNKKDAWTYVSLTRSEVSGTCALGDTLSERRWSQRSDWDIAICGAMIRTNSGTSGQGKGGIVSTRAAYENVEVAPEGDYEVDKDTFEMW